MTELLERNWTDDELKLQLSELSDTVGLYWDRGDGLSKEQIRDIVNEGVGAVETITVRLLDLNYDYLSEQADGEINAALANMRKKKDVTEADETAFRELVCDSDKLAHDANIDDLINSSSFHAVIKLSTGDLGDCSRGITSEEQVEAVVAMCAALNVNPSVLSEMSQLELPDHPERDGNEHVEPEQVVAMLEETYYGGQLCFLATLDVADMLEHREQLINGPITIRKGTYCFPYDHFNGAGPGPDARLNKDIVLEGGYRLRNDSDDSYGIQSCYGLSEGAWRAGHVTI